MPHTVAALFETERLAHEARSNLIAAGVPHDDIVVCQPLLAGSAVAPSREHECLQAGLKQLLGLDDDNEQVVSHYCSAITEGRCLVAVDAPTEDHAGHAIGGMLRLRNPDVDAKPAPTEVRVYARSYDISSLDKARLNNPAGAPSGELPRALRQTGSLEPSEQKSAYEILDKLSR